MKVIVNLKNGRSEEHEHDKYTVMAEPNEHGDLVVYRNHKDMLTPQPVASYAAGGWVSHSTVWGEPSVYEP